MTLKSVVGSRSREEAVSPANFLLRAWVLASRLKFSCFLGEEPPELVPRGALATLASGAEADLIVNPRFRYQPESEPPAEVRQRALPLNACLRGYPIAWVEDPAPTSGSRSGRRTNTRTCSRGSARASLPPVGHGETRRTLAIAEILVPATTAR